MQTQTKETKTNDDTPDNASHETKLKQLFDDINNNDIATVETWLEKHIGNNKQNTENVCVKYTQYIFYFNSDIVNCSAIMTSPHCVCCCCCCLYFDTYNTDNIERI